MAAMAACMFNPEMKEFYGRLRERGKHHKVAVTANALLRPGGPHGSCLTPGQPSGCGKPRSQTPDKHGSGLDPRHGSCDVGTKRNSRGHKLHIEAAEGAPGQEGVGSGGISRCHTTYSLA